MPQALFGINIYQCTNWVVVGDGIVTLIAKPDEGSINFLRTNVLGAKLFLDLMCKGVSGIFIF